MLDIPCDCSTGYKEEGDNDDFPQKQTLYVYEISKGFRMKKALTQFAVKLLFGDSRGFDEVDNYFATEADTIIDIL